MKIEIFQAGLAGANCYYVINEETNEAVVIDPGGTLRKIDEFIVSSGISIKAILLTHGHFDHIMGIDDVLRHTKAPVYILEEDLNLLSDADMNASMTFIRQGYTYSGAIPVKDGEVLSLAGYNFKVIATPGHTEGSCCYYIESDRALFSGDTLFYESVGRTDLPGGSSEICPSIKNKLYVLPDDTIVYPGHNHATSIGHEKKNNPFVN